MVNAGTPAPLISIRAHLTGAVDFGAIGRLRLPRRVLPPGGGRGLRHLPRAAGPLPPIGSFARRPPPGGALPHQQGTARGGPAGAPRGAPGQRPRPRQQPPAGARIRPSRVMQIHTSHKV
eukprot:3269398-Pyramimonas_sp.AAC.1